MRLLQTSANTTKYCHKASQIALILKASDGSFMVLSTSRFMVLSMYQEKLQAFTSNTITLLAAAPTVPLDSYAY